jgi:hypothetical protein
MEERIFQGIPDRGGDLPFLDKKVSNSHDEVDVPYPCGTTKRTGAARCASPQLGPLEKGRSVICIGCLSDKPPHIQWRPELDRAATGTRPTLDAQIQMIILGKSFWVGLHLSIMFCRVKSQSPNSKLQIISNQQASMTKRVFAFWNFGHWIVVIICLLVLGIWCLKPIFHFPLFLMRTESFHF